jgi:1-acyl-sn-glycerol-3-phosphate acyltransferase
LNSPTPRAGRAPRGGFFARAGRRAWRSARLIWLILLALWTCWHVRRVWQRKPREIAEQRAEAKQTWFVNRILDVFQVKVTDEGTPLARGHLAAANHIAVLDIPAMSSAHPGLFVAKAQIADWPILGYIIASAGTIFITRERARDSVTALSQMEQAIHSGRRVLFFPEGTTSPGDRVRRFHTSLFAAACRLGVPVQPVALFYEDLMDPTQPNRAVPFIGDQDVVRNLWMLFAEPEIRVRVSYLEPVIPGDDRRELADQVRAAIATRLGVPLEESARPS